MIPLTILFVDIAVQNLFLIFMIHIVVFQDIKTVKLIQRIAYLQIILIFW